MVRAGCGATASETFPTLQLLLLAQSVSARYLVPSPPPVLTTSCLTHVPSLPSRSLDTLALQPRDCPRCPRGYTRLAPMEDESRAPRGDDVGSPSDSGGAAGSHAAASDPTAATATAAAEDTGHMQQHDDGAGAGEPRPFANTGDEDSVFTTAAAKTTTPPTDSGHATGEHKEPVSPTDLAASPRSGATGFVAPSSYLRPLAATRDREDHYKSGKQPYTAGEPGAKRVMHPLDREQREGLVSDLYA